jgi:hypothetical protein
MFRSHIEAMQQRLEKGLGTANAKIRKIEATNRVELDEFYFRAFLPVFAGDEDLMYFKANDEFSAHQMALIAWGNVAGNPFSEVDVIRVVEGKKEILFTVPGLLNRKLYKPTHSEAGEPNTYGAVLNSHHLTNYSTMHGENYLKEFLRKREGRMKVPEMLVHNAQAWNKIFAFYGRPPMVAAVAEGGSSNQAEAADEVVGFDPL